MDHERLELVDEIAPRKHYRKLWKCWFSTSQADGQDRFLINRIPSLRKKKSWTIRRLATVSGLTYNVVMRMNQGGRPKLKDAYRVACAFDLTVYELCGIPATGHALSNPEAEPLSLRELRDKHGWSLDTLAQLSGVPITTISRIERGQEPHLDSAFRIATALDMSVYRVWALVDTRKSNR